MSELTVVAQTVLDAAVVILGQIGATVPTRRYIHWGQVAADCEQLVATVTSYGGTIRFPDAHRGRITCAVVPQATVCLEYAVCVPVPDDSGPPSQTDLDAAGAELQDAAQGLWCGLVRDLPDLLGDCTLLAVGEAVPVGPLGGIAAVRICSIIQTECGPQGS